MSPMARESPIVDAQDTRYLAFLRGSCRAIWRMVSALTGMPRQASSITRNASSAPIILVSLPCQFMHERTVVPDAIGNKMLETIALSRRQAGRHRLNTLTISKAYQAGDVKRAHGAALSVPKPIDKRL